MDLLYREFQELPSFKMAAISNGSQCTEARSGPLVPISPLLSVGLSVPVHFLTE